MTAPHDVVVFFDCDKTLLDNDLVQQDLRAHLAREFGPASRDRSSFSRAVRNSAQ